MTSGPISAPDAVPSATLSLRDAFLHAREQGLGGAVSHRHGDRDGHAPLPGRAISRAGQRVGGLVHIRIGHHDHVVLRPAQSLHPLTGWVPRR